MNFQHQYPYTTKIHLVSFSTLYSINNIFDLWQDVMLDDILPHHYTLSGNLKSVTDSRNASAMCESSVTERAASIVDDVV